MKTHLIAALLALLLAHAAARDVAAQDLVISNARIIVGNGRVLMNAAVFGPMSLMMSCIENIRLRARSS